MCYIGNTIVFLNNKKNDKSICKRNISDTGSSNFEINSITNINLDVYDILGGFVKTIFNGINVIGSNSLTFSSFGLSKGMYFIRLNAGGAVKQIPVFIF